LFTYGEEKLSRQIAEAVVTTRQEKPCKTNGDLVELVLQVYRKKLNTDKEVPWIGGLHPATKTFQAIRIVVNDEYGVIESVLPQAIDVLKPGGRVGIISFHSGEDRIVKHFGKAHHNKTLTIVTKKPIMCGEQEYQENPPSRSAKLRVFQRIS
jgi:16S rRNA (cytosine1402-N4)-methyltransferase